jgi:hypothetical protein
MTTPASRTTHSRILDRYPDLYETLHEQFPDLQKKGFLKKIRIPKNLADHNPKYNTYWALPSDAIRFRLHLSRANSLFTSAAASLYKYCPYLLRSDFTYQLINENAPTTLIMPGTHYRGAYKLDRTDIYQYIVNCVGTGYFPSSLYRVNRNDGGRQVLAGYVPLPPTHVAVLASDADGPVEYRYQVKRISYFGEQGVVDRIIPRSLGQLDSALTHFRLAFYLYSTIWNLPREQQRMLAQEFVHLLYPRERAVIEGNVEGMPTYEQAAALYNSLNQLPDRTAVQFTYPIDIRYKIGALRYITAFDHKPDCIADMPAALFFRWNDEQYADYAGLSVGRQILPVSIGGNDVLGSMNYFYRTTAEYAAIYSPVPPLINRHDIRATIQPIITNAPGEEDATIYAYKFIVRKLWHELEQATVVNQAIENQRTTQNTEAATRHGRFVNEIRSSKRAAIRQQCRFELAGEEDVRRGLGQIAIAERMGGREQMAGGPAVVPGGMGQVELQGVQPLGAGASPISSPPFRPPAVSPPGQQEMSPAFFTPGQLADLPTPLVIDQEPGPRSPEPQALGLGELLPPIGEPDLIGSDLDQLGLPGFF